MWIIVAIAVTVWVTFAVVAALVVGRMVQLRDDYETPEQALSGARRRQRP